MKRALGSVLILAVCGAAVGVVVWVADLANESTHGSPSDMATWIEAIATLGALAAAAAAAIFAARVLSIEDGREQRVRDDIRKHQASRVAAWAILEVTVAYQSGASKGSRVFPDRLPVYYRNASELPVTDMRITIMLHGPTEHGYETIELGDIPLDTVPPMDAPETEMVRDYAKINALWPRFLEGSTPTARVDLAFRDANDVAWLRRADGTLEDLSEPRPHRWWRRRTA